MSTKTKQMPYQFGDLIDVDAFTHMLDSFFQATNIPNGVMDMDDNLLSMTGGDNAFAVFHRTNPESEARCHDSNIAIMYDLRQSHTADGLCQNGLMYYATPVVVEGHQLATFFLGQVLHTPPDLAYLRKQAMEFGYDETGYLASIQSLPVISKERIESLMEVMVEMAQVLAASGLARLRQVALERGHERRMELEDILNLSPVAIGLFDAENKVEYVNQEFTNLLGYNLEDLSDTDTWYLLAYPDEDYRESVIYPWVKSVKLAKNTDTSPPELEASITCKDTTIRRIMIRMVWIGERRLVNFTDITDRWLIEQRKLAHDAILEMIAKGKPLPDILHAIVKQVQSEDESTLCSLLLMDAEGKHLLTGAAPDLPDFYNEAINGMAIGKGAGSCGRAAFLGERVIIEDIQTHEYWSPYVQLAEQAGFRACWSEPIRASHGKILGTFAIYHTEPKTPQQTDIERIAAAANLASIAIENHNTFCELERRAYTDYLTGLSNRRHFFEQVESELSRVIRYGCDLSILMLDLDHFKLINDTHGHKVGDLVLKKFSEVCRATLRDIDITGRIGGEEFAVLLPETGSEQATKAAERLRAAINGASLVLEGCMPIRFAASFGVATLISKDVDIDTLLNQADQALYQAKNSGRNKVCVY
ncbi:MAG: diguanylate cyclase (GGDEF)-like protein [Methylophilaceae bacterium]|jgi:diguanylate cyclase (GGDEF)-like protein